MIINESVLRDILRLFIWFPFRWFVRGIPVMWGFFLFKLIGDLHFYLGGSKKNKIHDNLKTVLNVDDHTASRIVKRNLENHYIDRLHIFLYPKLTTKEKILEYVRFENIELVERRLKDGKGVLLVQPHFGPVQITLLALKLYGFTPIQIGYLSDVGLSRIGKAVAYRYRMKYEKMLPQIVAADRYLGRIYKHLVHNGVVLTTGDGAGGGLYIGEHGKLSFLNTKRLFPTGPASLSLRTGASYIPTFIIPEQFNKFRIIFEKPIVPKWADINKDKWYMTETFKTLMERYVNEFPYGWHFWDETFEH